MISNLEPPNITNINKKKICLKHGCPAPLNQDNNRHSDHKDYFHNIQDLVAKFHQQNLEFKEELAIIQDKLFKKIEKNENAIIALRSEDDQKILNHLQNLKEQSEVLNASLMNKNGIESSNYQLQNFHRLKRIEKYDEIFINNFKEMYQDLLNVKIFDVCEIKCQNHDQEKINALNLSKYPLRNQRLLCSQDAVDGKESFSKCKELLIKYCCQEKLLQLTILQILQHPEQINIKYYIRDKIQNIIQNLISKHQEYFQDNQKDFYNKYKYQNYIPRETYENLAQFLSQITEKMPFSPETERFIQKYDDILGMLTQNLQEIRSQFGNFLANQKPEIITITVEFIIGKSATMTKLEVEPGSNLSELFEYLKKENNWMFNISQAIVIIDSEKLIDQQINKLKDIKLKHDNYIQIQYPKK